MAEAISRSLRDGCLEGEHAPALAIEDSLRCPLGAHAFHHFLASLLSHISAGRSQARGLVLVAFNRSPSFYFEVLQRGGIHASLLQKFVQILDCYSDPLGWKNFLQQSENNGQQGIKKAPATVFKNVKDVDAVLSSIVDLGKEIIGLGKDRFAVAIDSASHMLRHSQLSSVSSLLYNLRSHDQISSVFWLMHSDLHETRASIALEYISTMIASIEPTAQSTDQYGASGNILSLEQNYCKAKFVVRLKRRNGRVKLQNEELHLEPTGIKFAAAPSVSMLINQNLLPKVQFNLQLSDKELIDRANVVLPFEHQGNGEPIQIYDGRQLLSESHKETFSKTSALSDEAKASSSERGEIHYVRDSDDEQPDSDEDPDDDLDI